MLDSIYDFIFALIVLAVTPSVLRDVAQEVRKSILIRKATKEMGLTDRGEVAKNFHGERAVHDTCGQVVRIGTFTNPLNGVTASFRYCWMCQCELGHDVSDTAVQPVALRVIKPEVAGSVIPYDKFPRLQMKHQAKINSRNKTDPPTAA
jgi:hypothetical protein